MSKVTKEELKREMLGHLVNPGNCHGCDAIRALISRADDVDRLVSAAWKVLDGIGGHTELRLALAPFMEKDKGDVPIFNEEGHSNEEKP